tara:strand:- start:280 stop:441 length:162 start_codon:yes stop_codon:yes gene_type:complete
MDFNPLSLLSAHPASQLAVAPPLLHHDLTKSNIMVASTGGSWNVCGLIDFGDR